MELTVYIPDDIATRLRQADGDLSRRALEALALEEYKGGHLTKPELRRLLGFETRYELDGFLKEHGVYEGFTLEEIEQQVEGLKQLGF
jgi:Uncharacterised protein family (UPF0175)